LLRLTEDMSTWNELYGVDLPNIDASLFHAKERYIVIQNKSTNYVWIDERMVKIGGTVSSAQIYQAPDGEIVLTGILDPDTVVKTSLNRPADVDARLTRRRGTNDEKPAKAETRPQKWHYTFQTQNHWKAGYEGEVCFVHSKWLE
jgi:hypothetical protein